MLRMHFLIFATDRLCLSSLKSSQGLPSDSPVAVILIGSEDAAR